MRLPNFVNQLGTTMFGSKFTSAFAEGAMDAARLGESAVRRSHATSAKKIIDQAIANNRLKDGFRDVAQNISDAMKKGDFTGSYEVAGQKLGLNDALQTIVYDGLNTTAADKAFADAVSAFKDKGMGSMYHKFLNEGLSAGEALGRKAGEGLGVKGTLSGFFQDAEYGSTRIKGALGGYAAASVGLRYLQGGDLAHNSRGEKDIAGIPFL